MADLRRSARVAASKRDTSSSEGQKMAEPALKKAKKSSEESKTHVESTEPPAGEDESPSREGEELWKLPREQPAARKGRRGSKTSESEADSTRPPAGEDETSSKDEKLWALPRDESKGEDSKSANHGDDKPPEEGEESTKPPAGEDEPPSGKDEELWKLSRDKEKTDVANDSDATAQSAELDIGGEVPDVTLQNQDGEDVSLRKVAEENRIIIIFAYPKASTPGCTRQACGFRDNYRELKEHAAVFGLSGDSVSAQKKFQSKQELPFDLLSDPKRILIGQLGAKKTAQSGTIRSHWVFFDGKLKYKRVKVSPEISVQDGRKEVLELAAKL
ncbi:hypothetical protein HG536_0C04080 [Torulaspora globosa]|uniref:thioredoxin-dependent peroxiredoxin n=1 Tax=Torulaspora globosa TaxID=48254 RepID=A0A7G3ZFF3_9SACH|nr:uncharacterized protein HG536_0C04080 [Torulaspora globosa]QLL32239.1 hypothetical protein HG536_0C04080 [Torulaspora globosa]